MRYTEFRGLIQNELIEHPDGMTWAELKQRLDLPYDQPCQTWVRQLEHDISLSRESRIGRAYVWKVQPDEQVLSG